MIRNYKTRSIKDIEIDQDNTLDQDAEYHVIATANLMLTAELRGVWNGLILAQRHRVKTSPEAKALFEKYVDLKMADIARWRSTFVRKMQRRINRRPDIWNGR